MKTIVTALMAMLWLCVGAAGQGNSSIRIETVVTAFSNVSLPDEDGDRPAYIILRNLQSAAPFILDDHFLTDDPQNPQKWQFPRGILIEPNEELILFASGKDRRPADGSGELHTNFIYPCSVPNLILTEPIEGVQLDQERDLNNYCVDCPGRSVIDAKTLARYLVPTDGTYESSWFTESFDPNLEEWARGGPCFGYEVVGRPEDDCLVLYSTMNPQEMDFSKQTILDVSGSPVIHNATYGGLNPGLIAQGQVDESVKVPADGVPRYLPHPELEPGRGDFTASLWINPSEGSQTQTIATKSFISPPTSGAGNQFFGWRLGMDKGGLRLAIGGAVGVGGGHSVVQVAGEAPKAGEWTHVLFRVDRKAETLSLYVNGALQDSEPVVPTANYAASDIPLDLGNIQLQATFQGLLDEFAIWKCALSDEMVADIYGKGSKGEPVVDLGGQPTGLEATEIYQDCIDQDIENRMFGVNSSLWAIYPFSINNPDTVLSMRLFLKYDDGYVVFLNGQEVARRNYGGASPPKFDAKANTDRSDVDALIPEFINLSGFRHLLKAGGGNRLAIAGLNADASATRFLLCPDLCIEIGETPPQDCKVTTEGQEFWVAFPGNAPTDPSNPLELSICVRGTAIDPTTVVGVIAADGNHQEVKQIGPDGSVRFVIPNRYSLEEGEIPEKSGIFVLATQPVSVYAQTRIDYSTDSYTVLPLGLLGDDYRVLGYGNVWNDDAGEILNGTQFAVCAAFDQTVVTIEPTTATASNPGGGTVTVNLDRGETYLMRSLEDGGDFSATSVKSNRPVAVFGGHRCANIPDENVFFCDTVVEQLLATKHWGRNYVTAPLASGASSPIVPRPAGDVIRVLAAHDNTDVRRNGVFVAMLNAGEMYETVETDPVHWNSKQPISVAQYSQSSDADGVTQADPFMALVQPAEAWLDRYRICSPVTDGFQSNYVNIVVQEGFLGSGSFSPIRINGAALLRSRFNSIPGTAFAYAREEVPVGANSVDSFGGQAPFPFGLLVYGFSTYDSYGHPGGMCFFDREAPQIFDCKDELVVHAKPAEDQGGPATWEVPNFGDELISYFDPGTGILGAQYSQSIQAGTQLPPGKYFVTIRVRDNCGRTADCVIQLTVMPPWQEVHFPNAYPDPDLEEDVWGWDADPDGDGKTNENEFRFGCDPNDPSDGENGASSSFQPNPSGGGGMLTLTFTRRAYAPGLTYVAEGSEDAFDWSSGEDVMQLIQETTMPGGEYIQMTFQAVRSGNSPSGRYFVRARSMPEGEGSPE